MQNSYLGRKNRIFKKKITFLNFFHFCIKGTLLWIDYFCAICNCSYWPNLAILGQTPVTKVGSRIDLILTLTLLDFLSFLDPLLVSKKTNFKLIILSVFGYIRPYLLRSKNPSDVRQHILLFVFLTFQHLEQYLVLRILLEHFFPIFSMG